MVEQENHNFKTMDRNHSPVPMLNKADLVDLDWTEKVPIPLEALSVEEQEGHKYILHCRDHNTLPKLVTYKEKEEFVYNHGERAWLESSPLPKLICKTYQEALHIQEGWMLAKGLLDLDGSERNEKIKNLSLDDYSLESCVK